MKKYIRLSILLILLLCVASTHWFRSLDSIRNNASLFERHYVLSPAFPFSGKYYLMKPKNYDTSKSYPLVVALHGISKRAYAAEDLATPKFREQYPVFVMVPIAPTQAFWASPKDQEYRMPQAIPYPDHLPVVMGGIRQIKSKYNIDESQIIIVGHSMGGSGVIGALQRYPYTFKAGIASAGAWSPNEISNISAPLYVYHGAQDNAVPAMISEKLKISAHQQRKPISVTIIPKQGHGIGHFIYSQEELWDQVLKIQ